MSEMKFTEGFWRAQVSPAIGWDGYEIAWSDDGELVAERVYEKNDAQVMAASKELFNAAVGAEQALADFIGVYGDNGAGEVLAELQTAIAKAKGGGDV